MPFHNLVVDTNWPFEVQKSSICNRPQSNELYTTNLYINERYTFCCIRDIQLLNKIFYDSPEVNLHTYLIKQTQSILVIIIHEVK